MFRPLGEPRQWSGPGKVIGVSVTGLLLGLGLRGIGAGVGNGKISDFFFDVRAVSSWGSAILFLAGIVMSAIAGISGDGK